LTALYFPQAQESLKQFCQRFSTPAVFRPPEVQQEQMEPEYVSFRYSHLQEDFKRNILAAYNFLAREIQSSIAEMTEQLLEGAVQPSSGLDISKMRGAINYMLDRVDMLSQENLRLGSQLRLLDLLVDSVDLAETIGVGFAAGKIRDVIQGTGNGGGMANELEFCEFPLEQYTSYNVGDVPAGPGIRDGLEEGAELSPRLENLNYQLRKYLASRPQASNLDGTSPAAAAATCRILVFVNTRTTVNALKGYLTRQYPELNPNFVVGHGGLGGQSWGEGDISGGQSAIIKDFHRGVCQLLVCTTVLEEGIDVSDCDLVIRYTGVNSLIQFIQSRGRARRAGSRYVIIVTREEHDQAVALASQEKIMDFVLTEHAKVHSLPAFFTRSLISRAQSEGDEMFQSSSRMGSRRESEKSLYDAASNGAAVVVEFYLEATPNLDLEKVYDYLQGALFSTWTNLEKWTESLKTMNTSFLSASYPTCRGTVPRGTHVTC
jgi:hypothetical protein